MKKSDLKLSFEFFPTKNSFSEEKTWAGLKRLENFNPEFFSVTFGAGGGEKSKSDLFVKKINKDSLVPVAGHLTCVDMSKDEINDLALGWYEKGVTKIVALRGDVREKNKKYAPHPDGYQNASDMCLGLKKLANFEVAVGGYPEIHPDSKNERDDIDNLKRKVDAGADKIITQYFFDKDVFLKYRDTVVAAGINIPIIPGIMPISNFKKVKNFSAMCGASIPDWISNEFSGLDDTPEVQQLVGASLASDLVKKLKKEEVNEFHFYTLNKYELTFAVCSRLLSLQNNLNQNNQTKGEARA